MMNMMRGEHACHQNLWKRWEVSMFVTSNDGKWACWWLEIMKMRGVGMFVTRNDEKCWSLALEMKNMTVSEHGCHQKLWIWWGEDAGHQKSWECLSTEMMKMMGGEHTCYQKLWKVSMFVNRNVSSNYEMIWVKYACQIVMEIMRWLSMSQELYWGVSIICWVKYYELYYEKKIQIISGEKCAHKPGELFKKNQMVQCT